MNKKRTRDSSKEIAEERIIILLTKADVIYSTDQELAIRYGNLARKIAMKAKVKIPQKWRFRFCRKCKKFLYPGINSHVRVKSGKPSRVALYCEICSQRARNIVFKN